MNLRRLVLVVFVLELFLSNSILAAGSKKKPRPPALVALPTIAAVTADSITIRDEKTTKTLTITQFTEINLNGRKATAAELKPGMTVNAVLSTDPLKASRINAMEK